MTARSRIVQVSLVVALSALLVSSCGRAGTSSHSTTAGQQSSEEESICDGPALGNATFPSGPTSVQSLADLSNDVVLVTVAEDERVLTTSTADSTVAYRVGATVHVDESLLGSVAVGSEISIVKTVVGSTRETAEQVLSQAKCVYGMPPILQANQRYLIGANRWADESGGDDWWYSVGGAASTIRIQEEEGELKAAPVCPRIGGAPCTSFPYSLDGDSLEGIKRDIRDRPGSISRENTGLLSGE